MWTLKSFSSRWWVYYEGFREGLAGLAERVNAHVEQTKLLLSISELEGSLAHELAALGRRIHEKKLIKRDALLGDPRVQKILSNAGGLRKEIRELERQASQIAQDELSDILLDFQQRLRDGDRIIRRWTVVSDSPCLGREVGELRWVEGVFLLCLARQERIHSPSESLHLSVGDTLWVVGPVLDVDALRPRIIG